MVFISAIIICPDAAIATNTINLQQYQTILIGWTQQQVTQLLGGPGTTNVQSGTPGSPYYYINIQYAGSQTSSASASFTFTGGVLSSKSQNNLDTGVYTINYQQYTAIQTGLTRAQVTTLVGTAGNAMSESGTGSSAILSVQYTGSGYSIVSLTFIGGRLSTKIQVGLIPRTSNTVTLQLYQAISIGWTQQQVAQLLGGPGTTNVQSGTPGSPYYYINIQYAGSQTSSASASFTFTGGALSSKSQNNLDTGVYTINYVQFTIIQMGWTRAQVTTLIGTAGNAMSESGTGSSAILSVQYKGSGYSIVSLTFVGGSLSTKIQVGLTPLTNTIITLQQYQAVSIGWTQQQVAQLLGGPGTTNVQSGTPGSPYYYINIQYAGSQTSSASASFTFTGGALSSKSQNNLDTGVYTINYQQYTAIQTGWTRAQVTTLVGTAGNAMSESGTGSSAILSVQYKGSGYSIVSLTFVGGSLSTKIQVGLQ